MPSGAVGCPELRSLDLLYRRFRGPPHRPDRDHCDICCSRDSPGRYCCAGLVLLIAGAAVPRAAAEALLVIEVDSGKVLHAENAGHPWYPASITKLMTTYVTLQRHPAGPADARDGSQGVGHRRGSAAGQDGLSGRHAGHGRQRAQDAAGALVERHGRGPGRRRRRLGRGLRGRDERDRAPARHGAVELRQSERPAGRRTGDLGARPRDPGPRAAPRVSRIRLFLAHPGDQVRQDA